jgi:D-hydroxyproline dehydrogenase subunit alpha
MPDTDSVTIRINGAAVSVPRGSSIAAAVLAAGVWNFRQSVTGDPRAPLCGMGICFECRVTVNGRAHVRSCETLCAEGLDVRVPDDAAANGGKRHAASAIESYQFDVLIIGAGPAGIAASCAAAEHGVRVAVVDDHPGPGGQVWRGLGAELRHTPPGCSRWHSRLERSAVTFLYNSTVVAQPSPATLLVETPQAAALLKYDQLILATGARERFLPFPGWTLPGVLGAGGLQALVKTGLSLRGSRVVIAGSGPLLVAVAAYLKRTGARIELIAEQAPAWRVRKFVSQLAAHPGKLWQALSLRAQLVGVPYRFGTLPTAAGGRQKLEWVELGDGQRTRRIGCDYLACGFHLVPNLELAALLGCEIENGHVRVDQWQQSSLERVYCAGELVGIGGLEIALIEGSIAGYAAAGNLEQAAKWFSARRRARRFATALEQAFTLRDELRSLATPQTFLCRCEDVTLASLRAHRNWRSAKLHTRCGMGPCQGRVCGPAVEFLLGWQPDSVRPPLFPVRAGSLMMSQGRPAGETEEP